MKLTKTFHKLSEIFRNVFVVKIHSVAEDLIFYRITDITRKHKQFSFFLIHWDKGLGKSSTVIITPTYLPNWPVSTPSHNANVHQTFLVNLGLLLFPYLKLCFYFLFFQKEQFSVGHSGFAWVFWWIKSLTRRRFPSILRQIFGPW